MEPIEPHRFSLSNRQVNAPNGYKSKLNGKKTQEPMAQGYAPGWGGRIEALWVGLGFGSQAAFAMRLGVAESQLSRWVNEAQRIRRPQLWLMAALASEPDRVFRWLTEGGERPQVNGPVNEPAVSEDTLATLRDLARRIEALEQILRTAVVEEEPSPPEPAAGEHTAFSAVQVTRKAAQAAQDADSRAARKRKRPG